MVLEGGNHLGMGINKVIQESTNHNSQSRSSSPRSSSDEEIEVRGPVHKPYGCYYCGYRSGYKYYLVKHMESHVREKSYTCSECGKQYNRKEYLNEHTLVSNGHESFGCVACGTPFTYEPSYG